jgi:hypothetical protein
MRGLFDTSTGREQGEPLGRGGADHLRRGPARAPKADDDPGLLCALDPSGRKSHIDRLAAARLAVVPKMPAIPLDDTDAGKVWHQSGAISTNVELTDAEVLENWSRRRDLNPRPADYEEPS